MTIMVVAVVLQKATEHLHPSTGVRMPHSDQGRRLPASVQRLSASSEWGHLLARASGNRVGRVYVANEDPPRLRRSASRRHRRRWLPHRTVWQQRGGQPCWLFCARPVEAQTRVQPQTCRFHQVWERYGTCFGSSVVAFILPILPHAVASSFGRNIQFSDFQFAIDLFISTC